MRLYFAQHRWGIRWGALALVAALSGADHAGWLGYRASDRIRYGGAVARITHAADGDTIDVDLPDGDRAVTRVRLWGVDCPEIGHEPGAGDAYFGREAAEFVRGGLVGRRVRLRLEPFEKPRDKYGRLLAYVYLEDEAKEGLVEGGSTTNSESALQAGEVRAELGARDSEIEADVAGFPVMMNELLVDRGLAYADRRFEHVMKTRFVARERAAMRDRRGLWAGVKKEDMPGWRQRMDAAGAR